MCSGETVKSSDCGLVMMNRFEEIHGGEEEMRLFVFPRRQRESFLSSPSISDKLFAALTDS